MKSLIKANNEDKVSSKRVMGIVILVYLMVVNCLGIGFEYLNSGLLWVAGFLLGLGVGEIFAKKAGK